jgi:hypothetical protein
MRTLMSAKLQNDMVAAATERQLVSLFALVKESRPSSTRRKVE